VVRDLRDPQKLGEKLLELSNPGRTLSQTYRLYSDTLEHPMFPIYPQDESMATVTAKQYREELAAAAAAGDIYAASMLKGLPYDEPGDAT
jgi:hypothetical protein